MQECLRIFDLDLESTRNKEVLAKNPIRYRALDIVNQNIEDYTEPKQLKKLFEAANYNLEEIIGSRLDNNISNIKV